MTLERRVISVPTINDDPPDFDRLFQLWGQVNDDSLDVEFNFTWCRFLQQTPWLSWGG